MKGFKNRSSAEKQRGYVWEKKKKEAVPVTENTVLLVIGGRSKDLIPLSISIDFVEDVFVASPVH